MDAETINRHKVMQIATSSHGQPWVCSVYFVLYEGNFYWLSLPDRRHSKELEENSKAALAIALKQTIPVTGLQAEGEVQKVNKLTEVEGVLAAYVKKYDQGRQFITRFKAGENRHTLYRFTPTNIVVFDETIPADQPYRTISFNASNLSHRAISRVGIRKKGIL